MALSDGCGSAVFHRDAITSATGSLEREDSFTERHFHTLGDSIRVLTTTVDSVAAKEGMPTIIKIDVEGHEPKVFAGAWSTIEQARPVIFFESCPANAGFHTKLNEYDYVLFDSDHGGIPGARTRNYVAVLVGSPLEAVAREHLAIRD